MPKPSRRNSTAASKKSYEAKRRKLSVPFTTCEDLTSHLGQAIDKVSAVKPSRKLNGAKGFATVAPKTFLGYEEALKIVLACAARTGPEELVVDPQAPGSTKDQILRCILAKVRADGFTLSPAPKISDGETCDALANEVQYGSN